MKLTFFSAEAMVLELPTLTAVVTDMMLESSAHVRTLCMGIYVAVGAVYSKVDWDYIYIYIYILLQLLIFCYQNAFCSMHCMGIANGWNEMNKDLM